ncbi:hypothetical protein [Ralstonia phage RP13]|nr:hypothetical protein [Ralstonia phage RP13]
MGSFDTVRFKCPTCSRDVDVQTKGGVCNNKTYSEKSVPISSAEAIINKMVDCPKCDTTFKVSCNVARLPLFLEEVDGTRCKYD